MPLLVRLAVREMSARSTGAKPAQRTVMGLPDSANPPERRKVCQPHRSSLSLTLLGRCCNPRLLLAILIAINQTDLATSGGTQPVDRQLGGMSGIVHRHPATD